MQQELVTVTEFVASHVFLLVSYNIYFTLYLSGLVVLQESDYTQFQHVIDKPKRS